LSASKIFQILLRAFPITLLIAVALHQIFLARSAALSPWSGGGFGMFSTLDHGSRRHLHTFVLRPGLRREVLLPDVHADEIKRALTLPNDARLRRLARTVSRMPSSDYGSATAVQIQIWNTRFDPETLTPTSQVLREFVLPLENEN